ncbi:NAD(P)-dependent alcohol dehydrogenase [Oryzibacter oryziterrae]|uniref:NAD(P)-dependent alcohol dehydrogenase n=1 Tax=Oryzibacter oryziterrae TaxID=2766474 RepID=UPI001F3F3859|nr:NAD(P)-dependent alcohol dehydrogenase [Oryzibacter oryziterrae]
MKIQAAIARHPRAPMDIAQVDLEEPRADEVLVKVAAVGICHTDLVMRDQYLPVPLPAVLGHEGSGVVERVGSAVTKVRPGDRVVMTFNACGACPSCRDHQLSYCHEFFPRNFFGRRPDGSTALKCEGVTVHSHVFGQSSFASHALCREINVVKVRDGVPLDLLGPLACGIQTGAGTVINGLKIGPGKRLAVFGAGSVGLSAVMAARATGVGTIIAIDLNQDRLDLALDLGATHIVHAKASDPVVEIVKITGHGVDFAIDATGLPAVIEQGTKVLAPRGTLALVGASAPGQTIPLDLVHMMSGGRSVRGVIEGESNADVFIPYLIDLYTQGRFPFDRLVTFYDFPDINTALQDAEAGRAIKPILRL